VSHSQEDDLLRSVVYPIDDAIVAQSEAVASFELAAEPLSGVGLGFKGPNLSVDAVLEVGSQFPEVFLEPSGRF